MVNLKVVSDDRWGGPSVSSFGLENFVDATCNSMTETERLGEQATAIKGQIEEGIAEWIEDEMKRDRRYCSYIYTNA